MCQTSGACDVVQLNGSCAMVRRAQVMPDVSELPAFRGVGLRPESAVSSANVDHPFAHRLAVLGVGDDLAHGYALKDVTGIERRVGDNEKRAAGELLRVPDGVGPPEVVLAAAVAESQPHRVHHGMTLAIKA